METLLLFYDVLSSSLFLVSSSCFCLRINGAPRLAAADIASLDPSGYPGPLAVFPLAPDRFWCFTDQLNQALIFSPLGLLLPQKSLRQKRSIMAFLFGRNSNGD